MAGLTVIGTVRVEGCDDLVDGREFGVPPIVAVVVEQDVAAARQALGDPMSIVLTEERPVSGCAHAPRLRVAPAIEQFTRVSRVVRDDPELAEREAADDNLVELCVVIDRVEMQPVRVVASGSVVDIDAPGVVGGVAEVGQARVAVLHDMVEDGPFPHDVGRVQPGRPEFENPLAPEFVVDGRGVFAQRDGLGCGDRVPRDREDVAVGQERDVVVMAERRRGEDIIPLERAVPGKELEPPTDPAAARTRQRGIIGGAEDRAIVTEVERDAGPEIVVPGFDVHAVEIDEVGLRAREARIERPARLRLGGAQRGQRQDGGENRGGGAGHGAHRAGLAHGLSCQLMRVFTTRTHRICRDCVSEKEKRPGGIPPGDGWQWRGRDSNSRPAGSESSARTG